jgi:cobalt-zinc-cadmium efflux system protein
LVTELISIYLLYRQQRHDLNVRGAFWHVLQTFVGSIIIIIAALVIQFTGFLAIDPLLGMLFGLVLVWASWGIMRDAIHLLMEGTPDDVDLHEVVRALSDIDGVSDIHHAHAWALTSNRYVFSAHLRMSTLTTEDQRRLQEHVHSILKDQFRFYFSTVQIESVCLDEGASDAINVETGKDVSSRHPPAHGEKRNG